MARVFIHVGAHKTGTSYLQSLFHLNRARLAGAGIHYPDVGPNDAHHALAAVWLDLPDVPASFFGPDGPEGLWDNLVARYAHGPGTLFLSAENFTRGFPKAVDFADLARRLSPFEEVRVIYTLRQQAELVQSLWLQTAKVGRVHAIHFYVRRAFDKRLSGGVRIDHGSVYEALLRGFDPEQIILLDYARIRHADGGIGQVFLDLLGAESGLRASDLVQPALQNANISPDPLAFQMATLINGNSVPTDDLVGIVGQVLRKDPAVPTTLLARYEHARFTSRFLQGNIALVERVQPWQPGFAFEESKPPENLIYRDDVTQQHWIEIAAALYKALPKPKPFGLDTARQHLSRLRNRLS
jgi:hypothetical protein